jgi:hypothetical protein
MEAPSSRPHSPRSKLEFNFLAERLAEQVTRKN